MAPSAVHRVNDVLGTRWIGQAHLVDEFEKRFAEYTHSPYSVAVNSGTSALYLAYRLAGLQQGDEVISPVLTSLATHHPLLWEGVKIVFADIDPTTLNIDPHDVAQKVNERTKAIIVVHYGGIPCDLDVIYKIAVPRGIVVVQDAAQAIGACYHGEPIGSRGEFIAFSFQAIKQLTTGDGGMLNLQQREHAQRAKRLRWFGIDRERKVAMGHQLMIDRELVFDVDEVGYKYQMNDIAAAIGLENLTLVERWVAQRKKRAARYTETLQDIAGITLLTVPDNCESSWWLFQILVERRDDFRRALQSRGVETNVLQIRNDVYSIFGGKRLDLPNMNRVESDYICIPIHNHLSDEEVEHIIESIKKGW